MSKSHRSDGVLAILLRQIDEGYDKKAWHGPTLRGSIRGVGPKEAAWRPGGNRHNIWEIMVHTAYWKYVVRRRILGEKFGSFPLKGSNFFKRPLTLSERAWREDIFLLERCHRSMREMIEGLHANDLKKFPKGSRVPTGELLFGIAAHDIYHAGQIQLLKRLMR
jgi:uncharacterized damage-inducible protein DinB